MNNTFIFDENTIYAMDEDCINHKGNCQKSGERPNQTFQTEQAVNQTEADALPTKPAVNQTEADVLPMKSAAIKTAATVSS